jgi:peptidoglycan hydrolase CwlO-like protein
MAFMAIDRAEREAIGRRGEQGRRQGKSDNEKALGADVERLLNELADVEAKRQNAEEEVTRREQENKRLREELKAMQDE